MDFLSKIGIGEPEEVRKNKKLIKQTEQKQNQLLKSVDKDINFLQMTISTIYQQIGEKVANEFLKDDVHNIEKEFINDFITEIKEKENTINSLEEKRNRINKRYGEELEMLKKLLPENSNGQNSYMQQGQRKNPQQHDMNNQSQEICPECGAPREINALFCISCGHKFE